MTTYKLPKDSPEDVGSAIENLGIFIEDALAGEYVIPLAHANNAYLPYILLLLYDVYQAYDRETHGSIPTSLLMRQLDESSMRYVNGPEANAIADVAFFLTLGNVGAINAVPKLYAKLNDTAISQTKFLLGWNKDLADPDNVEPSYGGSTYMMDDPNWPGLAKVIEETGELGQVLGKIIAGGGRPIYPWGNKDLVAKIEEEAADALAAIIFFVTNSPLVNDDAVWERVEMKKRYFENWAAGNHRA